MSLTQVISSLPGSSAAALALLVLSVGILAQQLFKKKDPLPLPPGPPGLPIVGNSFQIPLINPWRKQAEWTKQYGPIYRLKLGKDTVIVLGTQQAAKDLLEKRSKIYSSRYADLRKLSSFCLAEPLPCSWVYLSCGVCLIAL